MLFCTVSSRKEQSMSKKGTRNARLRCHLHPKDRSFIKLVVKSVRQGAMAVSMLTVLLAVQAALTSWVQLCEAMASWRMIQDEGLCNELTLLMQAFKANLVRAHTPVQHLVN